MRLRELRVSHDLVGRRRRDGAERRPEIAQLGLKAILAGTLATLMTASVGAVLV